MTRKYIDCRESPETAEVCSVAISADTEDEVVEAAARHAEEVHGFEDTPELREHLRGAIKEGSPRL
jgi:predicted small metal-binding protein